MTTPYVHDGKIDRQAVAAELAKFLKFAVTQMRLRVSVDVRVNSAADGSPEEPEVVADLRGPDQDALLERGAEVLLALEHLALRWLHLDHDYHDRIRLDCADHRSIRLTELKLSAQVAAERVQQSRQPFHFNPMGARERRLIHVTLKDLPGIRTESEGAGELRHLVIYPR